MSLELSGNGSVNGLSDFDAQTFTGLGYSYVSTVYFTANGTFTKADYPWLRAIRVKCQGAGGGGSGCATTSAGEVGSGTSGGGGGYAESFITDIAGLSASVTVTVGSGGAGGAAGANAGSAGGNSSFGSIVIGNGGTAALDTNVGATPRTYGSAGTAGGTGDLVISGCASDTFVIIGTSFPANTKGGDSFLGAGGIGLFVGTGANGSAGGLYGGGGSGGLNAASQATARAGGAGAAGIVIVEVFA